ncbi:hypothetical protein IU500_06850 [Nocardia terpenica]|uniref:Uncharacterized protein n=1 Tax=Nocardia terpenica TaxID=455432 RepID=A0A164K084_9NOCA|nr:hypothetical protein [Nocardia terpenica]KZM70899.1 hypothetical protein AWN90_40960 [Nocardia terpenica]MBF6060494.1 hypothetical protein [Nocardia terpenica]MBF6103754.1 hypothetical protein [Nocardia terpenica]MBF6111872.1 hypothetical protein [Nocardia terpenica]MBF6117975.1 hypothetical protein [Nocardia terpenica]
MAVQVVVAILAVAARFTVPGYLLLGIVLTVGAVALIGLLPMIIATAIGTYVMVKGNWLLRMFTVAAMTVMDLAVLTFALTAPDVVDDEDTTEAPITNLIHGRHELSKPNVAVFDTISGRSMECYLVAAVITACLALALLRPRCRSARG